MLCTACLAASRSSPAPISRATAAVVPYARKMNSEYPVVSTVLATASPASCAVPRWPTTAVSASRYSGSATSAPNAGTASRAISGSQVERRHGRVGPTVLASGARSATERQPVDRVGPAPVDLGEAGLLEHAADPEVDRGGAGPAAAGVHRVALHGGGAVVAGVPHRRVQQRGRDPLPPVADLDDEAQHRPDPFPGERVVGRRAPQPRQELLPRRHGDPAHRPVAAVVRQQPRLPPRGHDLAQPLAFGVRLADLLGRPPEPHAPAPARIPPLSEQRNQVAPPLGSRRHDRQLHAVRLPPRSDKIVPGAGILESWLQKSRKVGDADEAPAGSPGTTRSPCRSPSSTRSVSDRATRSTSRRTAHRDSSA